MRLLPLYLILAVSAASVQARAYHNPPPPCPAPPGTVLLARTSHVPNALRVALMHDVGKVADPGEPFNGSDVNLDRSLPSDRLIFMWKQGDLWIVATEEGGEGYTTPIYAYRLSNEGATLVGDDGGDPRALCKDARELLRASQMKPPPKPPPSPQQGETPIDGKNDPVAEQCGQRYARMVAALQSKLHWKSVSVRVAHNPKWGTIWRADTFISATKNEPEMWWRTVCTKTDDIERPFEVRGMSTLTPLANTPR